MKSISGLFFLVVGACLTAIGCAVAMEKWGGKLLDGIKSGFNQAKNRVRA